MIRRLLSVVTFSLGLLAVGCTGDSAADQETTDTLSATLSVDDSTAETLGCQCTGRFEGASVRRLTRYAEDAGVILCTFSTATGTRDSLTAYDFGVFECGDSLLYESEAGTKYVVKADRPPLTATAYQKAPGKKGLFQRQAVTKHTFTRVDQDFTVQTSIIYDPPPMSTRRADSLKQLVRRLADKPNAADVAYEEFNPEALVAELFWCAMEGDQECRRMFDMVNDRGWTDAASGEAWSKFDKVLQVQDNSR